TSPTTCSAAAPSSGSPRKHGPRIISTENRSRPLHLSGFSLSFPKLSRSGGLLSHMLLSRTPRSHVGLEACDAHGSVPARWQLGRLGSSGVGTIGVRG